MFLKQFKFYQMKLKSKKIFFFHTFETEIYEIK